ncbi:MAG: tRNA (5-methylaminomethyl-2-thiouridine)(34)-methyltransferase MnmD [Prevotellaceae bacterium]|nr:tRNA (5-methylaminomethyl-2-thiouridine)(34)-methyltransferase MnmD [Prevotellaceae bacterium]
MRTTSDGSHTLFCTAAGETYHSSAGAIVEAMHVYVSKAFDEFENICSNSLKILEIGFGTGLNALLTMLESQKRQIYVYYETLEPFPLSADIYERLNYCSLLPCDQKLFISFHNSVFDKYIEYHDCFTFVKRRACVEDFVTDNQFDVIYFDAFSPNAQPEMWTENIFQKLYKILSCKGIILTYSSKGSVKRALRAAGFKVLRLSGAGSKHHMLKGVKLD